MSSREAHESGQGAGKAGGRGAWQVEGQDGGQEMNVRSKSGAGAHPGQMQTQTVHRTNPFLFAIQLGFFAGLLWGAVRWICYMFHFTKVLPGFIADMFYTSEYLRTMPGQFIGWAYFILFSIIASLLYTFLFKKAKGPWPGVIYGLFWWGVIFLLIGPPLGMTLRIELLGWDTFWTELCLFLLWGIFIGYTVAIEFNDERVREPRRL